MAKSQRDAVKEAFWREALERHGASGLSVREFCHREQLAENLFYSWRRTIGERDGRSAPMKRRPATSPTFAQAVVKAAAPGDSSVVVELAGGCRLRFSGPAVTEQLADLILALQSRGEP
jgi:transposase-like protein